MHYSPLANEAYLNLKKTNPNAAEHMSSFGYGDDKYFNVLQAADACAYEIRNALRLSLGVAKGALRKQFEILTDASVMFLVTHCNKDQMEHIVQRHKPGEPFKLDEIMGWDYDVNIKLKIPI